jgi:hypothetical protein
MTEPTITLKAASEDDDAVVRELAALDAAQKYINVPLPARPVVVALVDGRPVAAASLSDGSIVADPFISTADAVALLQARTAAAHAPARARRRWAPRIPRLRAA